MTRVFVLALLLAACDRRSQAGANWTLRSPDAGAPREGTDKGIGGAPVVAPTADAGVSMGSDQPPPAGFVLHDAGVEAAPTRAEPPLVRDAAGDVAGDARSCPETGPCD